MAYRASLGELCATFVLVYAACGSGIAVNQRLAGIDSTTTEANRQFGAAAALSGPQHTTQHHNCERRRDRVDEAVSGS